MESTERRRKAISGTLERFKVVLGIRRWPSGIDRMTTEARLWWGSCLASKSVNEVQVAHAGD
eukprot:7193005-Alexandrium_andersonii.AAC.1